MWHIDIHWANVLQKFGIPGIHQNIPTKIQISTAQFHFCPITGIARRSTFVNKKSEIQKVVV